MRARADIQEKALRKYIRAFNPTRLNVSGKRDRRRTGRPLLPRRSQQQSQGATRTCRGGGEGRNDRASVELVGKTSQRGETTFALNRSGTCLDREAHSRDIAHRRKAIAKFLPSCITLATIATHIHLHEKNITHKKTKITRHPRIPSPPHPGDSQRQDKQLFLEN